MRVALIVVVSLICKLTFSQVNDTVSYRDFLRRDKELVYPMFLEGINYSYTAPGKISNSGHGPAVCGAFNPARFFTKRMLFGIFVELKMTKNLYWPYRYNTNFQEDLSAYSDFDGLSHSDSLYASQFVRSTDPRSLSGNYASRWGIMFAPSRVKFPMVKIYRKFVQETIEAYDFNHTNFGNEHDFIEFKYKGIGVELLKILTISLRIPVYVSIFYERDNVSSSSIENVDLRKFMDEEFFHKYNGVNRFGFRIGLGRI